MEQYGTTQKGKFITEEIDILPEWSVYDKGRLVLVSEDDKYYLGGNRGWIQIGGTSSINLSQLNLGPNYDQINGYKIPITNYSNYFDNNDTVELVLEGLATGKYLKDESIENKHIRRLSIEANSLKLGISDTREVGAQSIPYQHAMFKKKTTISEVLDDVVTHYPIYIEQLVTGNDWLFETVTGLFEYSFYCKNIHNDYPVIQCYDQYGMGFLPSKLEYNSVNKRIKIYVPYKMVAHIIIIG